MSQADIMDLLKKCEDFDKDNRFMAALDLTEQMIKMAEHQKVEEALERRICAAFMKHLDDVSLDVQANAVKSIQRTAGIVTDQNLVMIVEKLAEMVTSEGKKEVGDIYSLAIRSTIQELKDKEAANMIRTVYAKLIKGLTSGSDDVKEEVLEILTEIFKKFGNLLIKNHNLVNKDELMKVICELLTSQNASVQKKATACLGQFAIVLNSKQLQKLMSILMDRMNASSDNKPQLLTQLQCIAQISRSVGDKLATYFASLVPALMAYPKNLSGEESVDLDNEIAEAAIQGVENMITMCPNEAQNVVGPVMELVASSITYDPNYQYQDADDDAEMEDTENAADDYGWDDDDLDDAQDFDDDTAWKVRKSTVKVVEAIFASCPESVRDQWQKTLALLSNRFIERVDHVKIDILAAFQKIVKYSQRKEDGNTGDLVQGVSMMLKRNSAGSSLYRSTSLTESVADAYGRITDQALKQMSSKNLAVRVEAMKTVSIFAYVLPEKLEENLGKILPYIDASVEEGNNDMILHALMTLRYAFRNEEAMELSITTQDNSLRLATFLSKALEQASVQILSSALVICGRFFVQLRDLDGKFDSKHLPAIKALHTAIWSKIQKADIDQLVKQNSIIAMCQLMSIAYEHMTQANIDDLIGILVLRLQNEFTRMAALKGLHILATTGAGVITLQNVGNLSEQFVALMHNVEREIHLLTLDALHALMIRYPGQFTAAHASILQNQLSKFIVDTDIRKTDMALQCSIQIIKMHATIQQNVLALQAGATFSGSSLIQGNPVVTNLIGLFEAGCAAKIVGGPLVDAIIAQVSLQARSSAKIAAVIICRDNGAMNTYLTKFMQVAQNAQESEDDKVRAVLCIGEIGTLKDLSGMANTMQTISALFQHENDQVRQAASISLGSVTIGNTQFFLHMVFEMIQKSAAQQKYMFLATMREIINNKPECLKDYLQHLMPLYVDQAGSDDEPIRNIVAESIGKLYIAHPAGLEQMMTQSLDSQNATVVSTIAKSFKFAAHKTRDPPANFATFIDRLIRLISHKDLAIKRNCMDSLSQVAYNKHTKRTLQTENAYLTLVRESLAETPIKPELVVTVDLGPFKHVVDHGAAIRKSAFCLLENICEKFNFNQAEVVDAVIVGFQDTNEDVQALCLSFMIKLTQICPTQVISKLDQICEKFQFIYAKNATHLKGGAAQGAAMGNQERSVNLIRGILRVTEALSRNQDSHANGNFQSWLTAQVMENTEAPLVKEIYEKICQNQQYNL